MSAKALLSASVSAGPAAYVEDVFSTYLYTGNGSTQTITNGIDLAGEGGLVWIKQRSLANHHWLFDTARGVEKALASSLTNSEATQIGSVTSFGSSGFILGSDSAVNGTPETTASWTFRKAAKFFDVVTYTGDGNGSTPRVISHNLGSVPGVIIIKTLGASSDWIVYHRSLGPDKNLRLNSTAAAQTNTSFPWQNTSPTSTTFTVTPGDGWTNGGGQTYVAYLFAHDAGGFGDAGTDSVVSCGSFTCNGSGLATVDLGWEPQWVLIKRTNSTNNWELVDTMRGFTQNNLGAGTVDNARLFPNLSNAETGFPTLGLTSTGFLTAASLGASNTYIYIAIRRGPMRAPESGTEVFAASTAAASTLFATGITSLDGAFIVNRTINGGSRFFFSRLTASRGLDPTSTAAEANYGTAISWDLNNAFYQSAIGSSVQWLFRRAPGFFDVVAYTGTGASITVNHNLGVTPELIIGKCRSAVFTWVVYHQFLGTGAYIALNTDAARSLVSLVSAVSATSFTGEANAMSSSGNTHIAYFFATLTGVSKVGSYTGTGTTLSIDCGFTAGARFVLIKRTDSTGDWYVWDTARGIISGNDPYLLLNSTAAEVTGTDYIDPLSSGFQISSTAPAAINASGGSFIFLAVA
jgi:hypothetical protein